MAKKESENGQVVGGKLDDLRKLLAGLKREDLRRHLTDALGMAALAARFTRTDKDDKIVAFLLRAVGDDATFGEVCDLLGIPA